MNKIDIKTFFSRQKSIPILKEIACPLGVIEGKLITKEKRHELYGHVAGGSGSINTGSGGAGGVEPIGNGAGGSGIVIVRYPSGAAPAITLAPGTNVKTTAPNGDGVATFTVSGTLTVAEY